MHADQPPDRVPTSISRRRFLGYLVAAPTVVAAAQLGAEALGMDGLVATAAASIPSLPEPSDLFDLTDLLTWATKPTANLVAVQMNTDGSASFALPRAEVGQGLTTSVAMLIAEELDLPIAKVRVTLADARPELVWNQITGGSNSIHSLYTPVRTAAAIARGQLLTAAAMQLGVPVSSLTTSNGVVRAPSGQSLTYGSLARSGAVTQTRAVTVALKSAAGFKVVGTPQSRVDALEIVTGRKQFAMDLQIPGALPTMVRRPPTINGTVVAVANLAAVRAMPGITDVVVIPTGVAVRGATFGQCLAGVNALQVVWGKGTEDGQSDATVAQELKKAELPMTPALPLTKTLDDVFTFSFASNSPLETNCAVADVRAGSAEIWSSLKTPIVAQEAIAQALGLPITAVKCHVVEGGGSFGRHLFFDAALEAAQISQAIGKPVKLMWHRTDDFRHGRTHPMCTSHVRIAYSGANVVSFDQRHTSVSTDFSHGLGEIISAYFAEIPEGNTLGYAQAVFNLSQNVPYNFGATTQMLNEVDMGFHTGSMRNIYSPNVRCAMELMVDRVAKAMAKDPYDFRHAFLKDDRSRAVLDKVAQVGQWGRPMTAGTAQGIAFHKEYKGVCAALVEIDCRAATVNRQIEDGVGGPRVTKVVFAVDVGLPVNPRGLEAQMLGGITDGIALALTSSLHIQDGLPLEGSWDNYFYTRQWNVPPDVQIIVMPPTSSDPGGAGEFGVAAAFAAVACAYARATGTNPTSFPINHDGPLGFVPLPRSVLPPEPTDGLDHAF